MTGHFQMLLLLWLLLHNISVYGYDALPEYQGFSEAEALLFSPPASVDAEYQSLLNAYIPSLEWSFLWDDSKNILDASLGSLSNKHFLHYSRLKLQSQIAESTHFKFLVLGQRDRETDQLRHMLEFFQRIGPVWAVHIYGEPSLYKRENDVGLAVSLVNVKSWDHRFYLTSHDITRADHNDQDDSFKGAKNPLSVGWTGQLRASVLRARVGVRFDPPVTWIRPQDRAVYFYNKQLYFMDAIWAVTPHASFKFRGQWDSTLKGREPDSAQSLVLSERWDHQRRMAAVSYKYGTDADLVSYEPGFMHAVREWTDQRGARVQHYNELPNLTVRWRGHRRNDGFDHLQVGYEMTLFNTFGDLALTPETQKHTSVESRVQTAYEFNLRGQSRFLLALNFDFDEWTPVPTFEGGHGQFRTEF